MGSFLNIGTKSSRRRNAPWNSPQITKVQLAPCHRPVQKKTMILFRQVLKRPSLEYSYKDDALGDPMINDYQILSLRIATQEDLDTISGYAFKVNEVLKKYLLNRDILLVDYKLEFGKLSDGTIVLADEISPDTCRFWDVHTHEKLDKDRFRRDLGGEEEAYKEILRRLLGE